jgi:hypothetical protein
VLPWYKLPSAIKAAPCGEMGSPTKFGSSSIAQGQRKLRDSLVTGAAGVVSAAGSTAGSW